MISLNQDHYREVATVLHRIDVSPHASHHIALSSYMTLLYTRSREAKTESSSGASSS
jgi:hypothetical protein